MKKTQLPAAELYTPYYNEWNADAYQRRVAFEEDPMTVLTSSTSGANVAITAEGMIGLTRPVSARFAWNGKTLEVEGPDDALFVSTGPGKQAWEQYHERLSLPPAPIAPHGRVPEYCTWVEQAWAAARAGESTPCNAISQDFVRRYLEAVTRDRWPRGRFTVDEGWCPRHGEGGFGDWTPRQGMDMAVLAREISAAGHVPGLWFAPSLLSPKSRRAQTLPEITGEPFSMTAESGWNGFVFLRPCDAAREYLAATFRRAWEWGFRKLKLDLFYGPKSLMIEIQQLCWEAAQTLPGVIELEGHIPDPFAARWMHVVRLNDVLIDQQHPGWRDVARAHFRVCRESAPRHMLNLDHLGGNKMEVTEAQWLEHAEMQLAQLPHGYPVISLLPEHVGPKAVEAADRLLEKTL